MLRRLLCALSVPLVTAGAVAALAAPASAQSLVLRDGHGDVWVTGAVGGWTPAPNSTQGDVTALVVRHQERRVSVVARYVDLSRTGSYASYDLRLRNGAGMLREFVLEAAPHHWVGSVRVFSRSGDPVGGCLVQHRIDYAHDTVRLDVPVSCLGTPRFVQANFNSYRARRPGTFWGDNPHDGRAQAPTWTRWLSASPGRVG